MSTRSINLQKRHRLSSYSSEEDSSEDEEERELSKRFGEASEATTGSANSKKKKGEVNDEEVDKDDEEKAARSKRPRLEIVDVIGVKGLIKIKNEFPARIKYRAAASAVNGTKKSFRAELLSAKSYSSSLVTAYKSFCLNLFPYLGFDDMLLRFEKFGGQKEMKTYVDEMRSQTRNAYLENVYGRQKTDRMVYELEHGRTKPVNASQDDGHGHDNDDNDDHNEVELAVDEEKEEREATSATPPSQQMVHDKQQPHRDRRRLEEEDEEETEMTFDDNYNVAAAPDNDNGSHETPSEQLINDEPFMPTSDEMINHDEEAKGRGSISDEQERNVHNKEHSDSEPSSTTPIIMEDYSSDQLIYDNVITQDTSSETQEVDTNSASSPNNPHKTSSNMEHGSETLIYDKEVTTTSNHSVDTIELITQETNVPESNHLSQNEVVDDATTPEIVTQVHSSHESSTDNNVNDTQNQLLSKNVPELSTTDKDTDISCEPKPIQASKQPSSSTELSQHQPSTLQTQESEQILNDNQVLLP